MDDVELEQYTDMIERLGRRLRRYQPITQVCGLGAAVRYDESAEKVAWG